MTKKHIDGIDGGRTVTIEIKIPNGRNCLKCPAKHVERDEQWCFEAICLLYGKKLKSHKRKISGTRDPWGRNKTVNVAEKCEACLNGSR